MVDSPQERVRGLLMSGQVREAFGLLEQEARAGQAWAVFVIAEALLVGDMVVQDVPRAVSMLEVAAGMGWRPAAMRLVTLYATGTGCVRQLDRARQIVDLNRVNDESADAQAGLLEREVECEHYAAQTLSEDPQILLYRQVLTQVECDYLASLAQPFLTPSFVEDPATGNRIPHPVRNSTGMSFGPLQEDLVVNRINCRIARLSGTDYECGEPLHILNYAVGQEYKPHVDALPGIANQRRVTAILYLNDDYEGGETQFPELDLSIRGKAGDMLLFANVDGQGWGDKRSLHAGNPVTSGCKRIATRWIRQRRYHPWEAETGR